jgi:polyisoprenoid-binding protein YceI
MKLQIQLNNKRNLNKTLLILAVTAITGFAQAQVFKTSAGNISFKSKTAIEEFTATNAQVEAAIAPAKNQIQFRVPVNGFQFKSLLMQKHFKEDYMETSQFQYSNFVGKISNIAAVNFTKDGEYPVESVGKLTMHGVTKDITVPGKVIVKGVNVVLKANFKIKCSDYQIKIPAASSASVSDDIDIAVDCALAK